MKKTFRMGYDFDDKMIIFISHSSKQKDKAHEIAKKIEGELEWAKCFVAHDDISPSKKWEKEIREHLNKMVLIVGLVSKDFNTSQWCQQEMGWALGRSVPYLSILLNDTPQGFINEEQGMKEKDLEKLKEVILKKDILNNADLILPKLIHSSSYKMTSEWLEHLFEPKLADKPKNKHLLEGFKEALIKNNQLSIVWNSEWRNKKNKLKKLFDYWGEELPNETTDDEIPF